MNELLKSIILIGGGGHAKVLIDLIIEGGEYKIAGIVDPGLEVGTCLKGIKVLGADKMLPELKGEGIQNVAVAVGSIKCNRRRKKLFVQSRQWGFHLPTLIHPQSIIAPDVVIKEGVQIMAGGIIQADTSVGEGTVLNTGAQIDHDCQVGCHVFLAPGAILCGEVTVGNNSFIGAGAVVVQGVRVGENAVIAAGAVVIHDVNDGAIVKGVPAR